MRLERDVLSCFAYRVAHQYGIEQTAVKRIIRSYLNVCREDLIMGNVVRLYGVVTLVPNPVCNTKIKTGACYCKLVAAETRCSYYTVREIVKDYLENVKSALSSGMAAELRRLCTIKPCINEAGEIVGARSLTSSSISRDLAERTDTPVFGVRVHTSKLLKRTIFNGQTRQEGEVKEV